MERVGIVNGCFDVLHVGHIAMFEFAKKHCDFLYVLIDCDEMVRRSKGEDRPINCSKDRKKMLEALYLVDQVMIFDSHDHLIELCKYLQADVHIVGEEYKDKLVVGGDFAKTVMFFPRLAGYSTTEIVDGK